MKRELIEKMKSIESNLQHGDKARAIKDIPVSEPTLNKYLAGNIVKIELAEKIIEYFQNLRS